MSKLPYQPFSWNEFHGKTRGMSYNAKTGYLMLIGAQWQNNGKPLPDNNAFLARASEMGMKRWLRARPEIERFYVIKDGFWHQGRVENDFVLCSQRHESYAYRGSQGGRAKGAKKSPTKTSFGSPPMDTSSPEKHNEINDEVVAELEPSSSPALALKNINKERDSPNGESYRRGSRLSRDFVIASDWVQDGVVARTRNGLADVDLWLEAERFCNYWWAKTGASATKIDWHLTWINWCLAAKAGKNGHARQHGGAVNNLLEGFARAAGAGRAGEDGGDWPIARPLLDS